MMEKMGPGLRGELLEPIDDRYVTENALFAASGHTGGIDLQDHLRECPRWYRELGDHPFLALALEERHGLENGGDGHLGKWTT
jgi:hypothetical protein